jgi:hypothetical protein
MADQTIKLDNKNLRDILILQEKYDQQSELVNRLFMMVHYLSKTGELREELQFYEGHPMLDGIARMLIKMHGDGRILPPNPAEHRKTTNQNLF